MAGPFRRHASIADLARGLAVKLVLAVVIPATTRRFAVIDPREVIYKDGRPHYRRNRQLVLIKFVFSRLVYGNIETKLLPGSSAQELETMTRFFNDAQNILWRVHPLHFLYGTKGDLPSFRQQSLPKFIPVCETIRPEFIARARRRGNQSLCGRVQKPIEGHGGRDVIPDPKLAQLELGALIQDRISPTAYGAMTPELRVMAMPDENGRLSVSTHAS